MDKSKRQQRAKGGKGQRAKGTKAAKGGISLLAAITSILICPLA